MTSIVNSKTGEYRCRVALNLYDSSQCNSLATQAGIGRHIRIISPQSEDNAIQVRLCEDDYVAWLPSKQIVALQPTDRIYQPTTLTREEIELLIPEVVAFAQVAMMQPNYYLWGGTIGPNYDCSGLIQAAFAAFGVWLPRDSYQQEEFTHKIATEELLAGDLIFFGEKKVNHVALSLGEGKYIHSSGKERGRDGISIDELSPHGDKVSQAYYQQLWGCGRVMENYRPVESTS